MADALDPAKPSPEIHYRAIKILVLEGRRIMAMPNGAGRAQLPGRGPSTGATIWASSAMPVRCTSDQFGPTDAHFATVNRIRDAARAARGSLPCSQRRMTTMDGSEYTARTERFTDFLHRIRDDELD
ncbi:MAG: hypothetical protein ACXW5U_17240 [Thermoanaerobaculia bacterium]